MAPVGPHRSQDTFCPFPSCKARKTDPPGHAKKTEKQKKTHEQKKRMARSIPYLVLRTVVDGDIIARITLPVHAASIAVGTILQQDNNTKPKKTGHTRQRQRCE